MDKKVTRRRKSTRRTSNGRSEEKPKVSEVTSEKEANDRLEAASVLSSLMFLAPQSSSDKESDGNKSETKRTKSSPDLTYFPNDTGIPSRALPHHKLQAALQGKQSRGRGSSDTAVLEQLPKQILSHGLSLLSPEQVSVLQQSSSTKSTENRNARNHVQYQKQSSRGKSSHVPATVNPVITVNKTVASALRNKFSSTELDKLTGQPSLPENEDETERAEKDSESSKKKVGTETKLPLKKRRLIGVSGSGEATLGSDINLPSRSLGLLSSTQFNSYTLAQRSDSTDNDAGIPSLVSSAYQQKSTSEEGYRPIQFDPRTSLLVLQDVKVALTPDEDGDLPLHVAVVHENLELVQKLIDIMAMSGKTVDRFNKLQQTPLHLAVLVNRPDIVMALLNTGANPNLLDRNGYTGMHIAVRKQFPECLRTIVQHSIPLPLLNLRDYEGYSPLHTCVELNDPEAMKFLIEHEADINALDGKAGRSVLFYATEYLRTEMVEYLLEMGASADLLNYAGVSPLMTATSANQPHIEALLKKSMDMYTYDDLQYAQAKKVRIPRIPSKSTLITSEHEDAMRSRSNSQDSKDFATFSRQSSFSRRNSGGSGSSPIDLSMNKSAGKRPSASAAIPQKGGRKRGRPPTKVADPKFKEKHASLLAALNGRFVDKSLRSKFTNDDESYSEVKIKREEENVGVCADPDREHEPDDNDSDTNDTRNWESVKRHKADHSRNVRFKQCAADSVLERRTSTESVPMDTEPTSTRTSPELVGQTSETGEDNTKTDTNSAHLSKHAPTLFSLPSLNLKSTNLLGSNINLASNFSDILKSIPTGLMSVDVFDMMKPLLTVSMAATIENLPVKSLSHSEEPSKESSAMIDLRSLSLAQMRELFSLWPAPGPPASGADTASTMKLPTVPTQTADKNQEESREPESGENAAEKAPSKSDGQRDIEDVDEPEHDSTDKTDQESSGLVNENEESAMQVVESSGPLDNDSLENESNANSEKRSNVSQENIVNKESNNINEDKEGVTPDIGKGDMETEEFDNDNDDQDGDADDDCDNSLVIDEGDTDSDRVQVSKGSTEQSVCCVLVSKSLINGKVSADMEKKQSTSSDREQTEKTNVNGKPSSPSSQQTMDSTVLNLEDLKSDNLSTDTSRETLHDTEKCEKSMSNDVRKMSAPNIGSHTSLPSFKQTSSVRVLRTSSPLSSLNTGSFVNNHCLPTRPASVPNVIPNTSVVGDVLKQGKFHTIYYKDQTGANKPIKIYIDDSEQSKEVLQQIMQSTQFSAGSSVASAPLGLPSSAVNSVSSVTVPAPQMPMMVNHHTPVSSKVISPTKVTLSSSSVCTMPVSGISLPSVSVVDLNSIKTISAKDFAALTAKGTAAVTMLNRPIPSVKVATTQSSDFQQAYIESLKKQAVSGSPLKDYHSIPVKVPVATVSSLLKDPGKTLNVKALKRNATIENPLGLKRNDVHEHIQGLKLPIPPLPHDRKTNSIDTDVSLKKAVTEAINCSPKRVNSDPGSPRSSGQSADMKNRQFKIAMLANEGTLTKVSPDIKSRLSKALQSPQRKQVSGNADVKSDVPDSNSNIPNHDHVVTAIATQPTSVSAIENRQHL